MGLLTRRPRSRERRGSDRLRLATYPPPYPDGWYRLLRSKSLRRGQVRYLECLGREIVVWRSEDADDVFAMSAACPHLGANLGDGRVCEDRIECPFHAWQFSGDGRAIVVPYSDVVPTRVATESFPVEEVHGQIFMYHRSGGGQRADEETPYPVPRIREVDEGSFVHRGHHNAGRIRTHMVELIENAADPAHFEFLHNRMTVPFTQIPVPGVHIEYTADLVFEHDQEPWRIPIRIGTVLRVLGRRIERTRTKTHVTYTGAGSILSLRIAIPRVGTIEIVQTQLPVAPLEQQVAFRWFADRKVPRILVWYAVGHWVSQWRNDVRIWEGKSFTTPPMLCQHDGEVMRLRNWYKQFFPGWEPSRRALAARQEGEHLGEQGPEARGSSRRDRDPARSDAPAL